jgi:hypothetical protein
MNYELPLGLPKGSIRALIALSIVGIAGYSFIVGNINPEQFLTMTSVITGFYFATRKQ